MDIHVVGGYKDLNGTSRELSNWLFQEMATLAQDFYSCIEFTLQTACITTMNTSCSSSSHLEPLVRGLALDCRTGQVWMAHCPEQGPAPVSRAARLWVQPRGAPPTLHRIFTHDSHELVLTPFHVVPFKGLETLLRLPDHVLLQYCSTSPDVEEDDFCSSLRRTLQFLKDNANSTHKLLRFHRCHETHTWVTLA